MENRENSEAMFECLSTRCHTGGARIAARGTGLAGSQYTLLLSVSVQAGGVGRVILESGAGSELRM